MSRIRRYLCPGWAYNTYWEDDISQKWFEIDTFNGTQTYIPLLISYTTPEEQSDSEDVLAGSDITFRVQYNALNTSHYIKTAASNANIPTVHPSDDQAAEPIVLTSDSISHIVVPAETNTDTPHDCRILPAEHSTDGGGGDGAIIQFYNNEDNQIGCELTLTHQQLHDLEVTLNDLVYHLSSKELSPSKRFDMKEILPSGQPVDDAPFRNPSTKPL